MDASGTPPPDTHGEDPATSERVSKIGHARANTCFVRSETGLTESLYLRARSLDPEDRCHIPDLKMPPETTEKIHDLPAKNTSPQNSVTALYGQKTTNVKDKPNTGNLPAGPTD